MSATSAADPARTRRGRPSTGARERILDAGLEVLKADGYAGLTIAKVAARAGENKALISYHFGSKQGLVTAAGRELGDLITADVLAGLEGARSVEEVIRGGLDGIWRVLDRDVRLARVYFDLTAVSVVEDNIRSVMQEVRAGWRLVLARMLRDADPTLTPAAASTAALLVNAGIEGLVLERVEAGDSADLRRARTRFVRSMVREIAAG